MIVDPGWNITTSLLFPPVLVQALSPGVVYVGHLSRTLAEPQLRTYFSQFGKILRLRLSRSKRVITYIFPDLCILYKILFSYVQEV